VGEDNVLWGTDSIWYGSPQDQIQAFRTFQIHESLREAQGYPALDARLRAKVFGLNALKPYGRFVTDLLPKFGLDAVAGERWPIARRRTRISAPTGRRRAASS
jgi:uncharacterized protein